MAIRFLEWSTASDVIYSALPYVRMTEAVACLSFSTIQLVLCIIPICREGRVGGARKVVEQGKLWSTCVLLWRRQIQIPFPWLMREDFLFSFVAEHGVWFRS